MIAELQDASSFEVPLTLQGQSSLPQGLPFVMVAIPTSMNLLNVAINGEPYPFYSNALSPGVPCRVSGEMFWNDLPPLVINNTNAADPDHEVFVIFPPWGFSVNSPSVRSSLSS